MKKKYIVKILEYKNGKEIEIVPGCIFSKPRDYSLRYIFKKASNRVFNELEYKINSL